MTRFFMILCLALVLRLGWVVLIEVIPTSDPGVYDTYARNLVEHGVYGLQPDEPGAYWAVGTSAVYAAFYSVFGYGQWAVVLPNLLSSMLVIWGLWDLGRRWLGEAEGLVAAFLFAIWPMAIQFTTILASELHFMAMTVLGLMAWDRAQRVASRGFWVWSLCAALALAAATYLRPVAVLIPVILALGALLRSPRQSVAPILKAAVITALIFAAVAPWTARNERVFGEPVFMSTNFWANFWMGNHPETDGGYKEPPVEIHHLGDLERADWLKERALAYLREDPAGFVIRTGWKAAKLHSRETIGVSWNETSLKALVGGTGVTLAKLVSTGWWYLVLVAALWGIVSLARAWGVWATLLFPPVWLWGYYTGVHAVIVIGDRYHMPAIPMIALLAAFGLLSLISRQSPQPDRSESHRY